MKCVMIPMRLVPFVVSRYGTRTLCLGDVFVDLT